MKSPRDNECAKDEGQSIEDYTDEAFNATEEGKRALATWYEREIGDISRRHIVNTDEEKENYYKWQRLRQAFTSRASQKAQRQLGVRIAFLKCFLCKDDVLLDVGCGDGWYMQQLISRGYENVFGIDIGHNVIAEASQKGLRVKVGDMHELDFPDNHFDVIFCSHALEHAHSPPIVLREFRRVLNDKGRVVIVVPVEKEPSIFHGHAFKNEQSLQQMLEEEGFTTIYMRAMRHELWTCGAIDKSGTKKPPLYSKILARTLTCRVTAVLYWNFRLNDARHFKAGKLGKLKKEVKLFAND